jgi:hypothetical protein
MLDHGFLENTDKFRILIEIGLGMTTGWRSAWVKRHTPRV